MRALFFYPYLDLEKKRINYSYEYKKHFLLDIFLSKIECWARTRLGFNTLYFA